MRNHKRSMLCVFVLDLISLTRGVGPSFGCPRFKALALSRQTPSHIVYNGVSAKHTVSQGIMAAPLVVY